MDQNKNRHSEGQHAGGNKREQASTQQWDGRDRRSGVPDRREQSAHDRHNRNTSADTRMMNEGSSR